jgi:hypothetical protein
VVLSRALVERLQGLSLGTEGYPGLVLEVRNRLRGETLPVDDDLFERMEHYAYDHGRGRWQLLLREILAEIEFSTPGT